MIINLYRAPVDIKLRNINNSNTPFYCHRSDSRERERERERRMSLSDISRLQTPARQGKGGWRSSGWAPWLINSVK